MIRQLLRYAALSTALFYNACQPPEEDLESKCQGEVLFEDEFDGSELDYSRWRREICGEANYNYNLNDGILELEDAGVNNCPHIATNSMYSLDSKGLCFEARWRGTRQDRALYLFSTGVLDDEGYGVFCRGRNNGRNGSNSGNEIYCATTVEEGENRNSITFRDGLHSDERTTEWHTTSFLITNKGVDFYIDEQFLGATAPSVRSSPVKIFAECSNPSVQSIKCQIDYIILTSF